MSAAKEKCTATDDAGYWWGADIISDTEPDFVKGKGIYIPETKSCPYVVEPGTNLCYRHRFMLENSPKEAEAVDE